MGFDRDQATARSGGGADRPSRISTSPPSVTFMAAWASENQRVSRWPFSGQSSS
jgi:hypothetical protein